MSSASNDKDGPITTEGLLHLFLFVCRGYATSVEVFLHRGLGSQYLGLQAAAVLVLVPIFGLFWEGHDLRPLLWFIPMYLVMCLITRIGTLRRWRRGEQCHSLYSGFPRFMGPKATISELTCKRFVEPLLVLAFGFLVSAFNAPLGTYFMFAAVCLLISVNLDVALFNARLRSMTDSVLEQEQLAERFREMRGDA